MFWDSSREELQSFVFGGDTLNAPILYVPEKRAHEYLSLVPHYFRRNSSVRIHRFCPNAPGIRARAIY